MIGPLTYVVHYAAPYSDAAAEAVLRAVAEAVAANAQHRDEFSPPDWQPPDPAVWIELLKAPWRPIDVGPLSSDPAEHTALSFAFSPTSEQDAVLRLQRDAAGSFLAHFHVPRLALEETATLRLYYRLRQANEIRLQFEHRPFGLNDYWEIIPSEPGGFVGTTNLRAAKTVRDALARVLPVERSLARNWETETMPPEGSADDRRAKLLLAKRAVHEELRRAPGGGLPYIEFLEVQEEEAQRLERAALESAHADIEARASRALKLVADLLGTPIPEDGPAALALFDQVLRNPSLFVQAEAFFKGEHPSVRFAWHAAAYFGTATRARWGGRWFHLWGSELHFVGPPALSVIPHRCVTRSLDFSVLFSLVRHFRALELLLTFDEVPSGPRESRPVSDFREILKGEHIARTLYEDHLRGTTGRYCLSKDHTD